MWGMRQIVGLLAWLATRAGADIRPWQGLRRGSFAGVVPGMAAIGQAVRPDKAGRLVPVPEEALEPQRSLGAHWALWAAVLLVILILAIGYVRRRLKAGVDTRSWLERDRYTDRK
jgi:hypothetical protein